MTPFEQKAQELAMAIVSAIHGDNTSSDLKRRTKQIATNTILAAMRYAAQEALKEPSGMMIAFCCSESAEWIEHKERQHIWNAIAAERKRELEK